MAEPSTFSSAPLVATPGAKMLYLIKRRPSMSREELVAHWFANHMPLVIQAQHDQAARGRPHARRYIGHALRCEHARRAAMGWHGPVVWDTPLAMPKVPHGTTPSDTFQQKAEPYVPWASTEYVVIDGSENSKSNPLP